MSAFLMRSMRVTSVFLDTFALVAIVAFSSNHENPRLPSHRLLAFRAACARAAHTFGAAGAFGGFERDVEDTRVLAFDGSSAHLLDHLMTPVEAIPEIQ